MVPQAWAAAEALESQGLRCGVVALPWLRDIDGAWLAEQAGASTILCLDNHYVSGGQGDAVLAALAEAGVPVRVHKLGVEEVPACGTNKEVLGHHRLDAASIAERVRAAVPAPA